MKATIKNIKENLRIKSVLTLFLCTLSLYGQKKTYFDAQWAPCKTEDAFYYSIQYKAKGQFVQEDYFKDGQLQMRALYTDAKYSVKTGKHIYYHYNGKISLEKEYQEGVLNGPYKEYDFNGQLEREGQYTFGRKSDTWNIYEHGTISASIVYQGGANAEYTSFYPSNAVKEKGALYNEERSGKWTYYYESGQVHFEAYYQHNARTGVWHFYYEDGAKKAQIQFLLGKIKSEIYYDVNGMPKSAYKAHILPQMKGGKEEYNQFLNAYQLPNHLKTIKGQVIIGFTVQSDGQLTNFKVIKGLHDELNHRLIQYLQTSNWEAGKIYHESLPIEHAASFSFE